MISSFLPKSLNRPLAIAAAAMLLQAGGAFAADLPHDAQTQARELLSGRPASRTASVSDTAAATGDGCGTVSGCAGGPARAGRRTGTGAADDLGPGGMRQAAIPDAKG
jgi:hypothetical protein